MLFLFIVLAGVLLACTAQAAPAPTETPTALPPTTKTTTQPSATAEPTAVPTVTPTPLSPDAQALKDIVFSDCIPVEEALPEGFEIPWDLLVMQDGAVYTYDLEDGTKVEISRLTEITPDFYYMFVSELIPSPDGKWLAYVDTSQIKLYVEPVQTLLTTGTTDRIVWDEEKRFGLKRWVDNNNLLYIYRESEESGFYKTVFLNPFTGEENEFVLEELPNYLSNHYGGALYSTHYLFEGEVIPDPTMKRLVYPEWEHNDSSVLATNTLWDIESQQPLARIRFLVDTINTPLWAQDGSNMLILGPNPEHRETYREEWFLVNANGSVRQVTQFQDIFQGALYGVARSSRSQDGRFLVFEFYYKDPEWVHKYLVSDLKSNILEGFCAPSLAQSSNRGPKWSPDSKYFIISSNYMDGKVDNIVVDVEHQTIYPVAQDMEVVGWIEKP